jgi:branched-chain amino acid transport system permease protein
MTAAAEHGVEVAAPRLVNVRVLLVGLCIVALLGLLPQFVKKPYVLHMGVMLFLAIIQGQAWNVLGGYAGQHSLGHAAYFGIGAYATMMLLELHGIAPWYGIWVGVVVALMLSAAIGSITFRLRGPYFVLASISVAEIIRLATLHFKDVTRGAEGFLLSQIPTLELGGLQIEFVGKRPFYYTALGMAVVTIAANWSVQHSKLGYYFQAIREDQDAARSLAISLPLYKNLALAISVLFTAWAGGFYAMFVKFIDPNAVFGIDVSLEFVLICIIGGIGSIFGPVVGALVLVPLSEILRNPKGLVQIGLLPEQSWLVEFIETHHLANAHLLVYGVLVVVVVLFAPQGVLGAIQHALERLRRRSRPDAALPKAIG